VRWEWANANPFGAHLPNENPAGLGTFAFNLRFPGQYFDSETGLHYNYFRDYDPGIGRYVQSDPIGLKGGINTYGYVGSAPLASTDQYGLANSGSYPKPNGRGPPACGYYDEKCARAGGQCKGYYCILAPMVCRSPSTVPTVWLSSITQMDCVRNCLIEEDKKLEQKRPAKCSGPDCPQNHEIDSYHCRCYRKCGLNDFQYPGLDFRFPCLGWSDAP